MSTSNKSRTSPPPIKQQCCFVLLLLDGALYLHCFVIGCVHFVSRQVISAQQLPKLNKNKEKSIVDPLVKVEIHGVPADNGKKETHHINNNGKRERKKTSEMFPYIK